MKTFFYRLVNRIWVGICFLKSRQFVNSTRNVRRVQWDVLTSIFKNNKSTLYGIGFNFNDVKTVEDFQREVPLTTYEDYVPYINRIKNGQPNVLTSEPVIMLELSSGSTAASKYIPYTKSLKKQFAYGINPWVYNLYTNYRELYRGSAYWSITPVMTKRERTAGGIPVGFEEDSQYFGFLEKYLLDFLFAVPNEIKFIQDTQAFQYITLLFLLKERHLSLISVWNPTFLLLLVRQLQYYQGNLIKDLENGTVSPPVDLPPELSKLFCRKLGKNKKRAKELERIFTGHNANEVIAGKSICESIWPDLKLISCWTDANAEAYIPELKRLFPNTVIQGKGLIATEAFISLPFYGVEGALLSLKSHFFEFAELDGYGRATGNIKLAHELVEDRIYSIVVTTAGGLYRYRLQDVVKVTGYANECPRMAFLGKGEKISDLCGEKLNDLHVKQAVEKVLKQNELPVVFYMVAPETDDDASYYVLFIEPENDTVLNEALLFSITEGVEAGLNENFHYNYCRKLGQLGQIRLYVIDGKEGKGGIETYLGVCQRLGQRAGNVKPCALHNKTGWSKEFKGKFFES